MSSRSPRLAGFTPAEPVDHVARLFEHFVVHPSGARSNVTVIDESGVECATATDRASCRSRAAATQWCTAETCPATAAAYELLPGAVDTKSEAVYLAIRDGFVDASCNWDTIEEKEGGFEAPISVPGDCVRAPGGPLDGPEEIMLRVERDGQTRIVARRALQSNTVPRQE